MSDEFIFVYGTLRRGGAAAPRRLLERHGRYLAEGALAGRLYEVRGYPGLILSNLPGDRVHGELYRITRAAPLLRLLDEYEGCSPSHPRPHEYVRRKCPVLTAEGAAVPAWVYVYNRSVRALRRITCGDYLQWLEMG